MWYLIVILYNPTTIQTIEFMDEKQCNQVEEAFRTVAKAKELDISTMCVKQ